MILPDKEFQNEWVKLTRRIKMTNTVGKFNTTIDMGKLNTNTMNRFNKTELESGNPTCKSFKIILKLKLIKDQIKMCKVTGARFNGQG